MTYSLYQYHFITVYHFMGTYEYVLCQYYNRIKTQKVHQRSANIQENKTKTKNRLLSDEQTGTTQTNGDRNEMKLIFIFHLVNYYLKKVWLLLLSV